MARDRRGDPLRRRSGGERIARVHRPPREQAQVEAPVTLLTDAGPLIALVDRDERAHERCLAVVAAERGPLLTTWPTFTEAMYVLGGAAGWPGQHPLWQMVSRDRLAIVDLGVEALARMPSLMEKYRDVPMDLADASLVAAAESRHLQRIFTLDSHFPIYRLHGRTAFEVVPAP